MKEVKELVFYSLVELHRYSQKHKILPMSYSSMALIYRKFIEQKIDYLERKIYTLDTIDQIILVKNKNKADTPKTTMKEFVAKLPLSRQRLHQRMKTDCKLKELVYSPDRMENIPKILEHLKNNNSFGKHTLQIGLIAKKLNIPYRKLYARAKFNSVLKELTQVPFEELNFKAIRSEFNLLKKDVSKRLRINNILNDFREKRNK